MICLWVFYHHLLHYFSLVISRISRIHMLYHYDLGIFLFSFFLLLLLLLLLLSWLLFQLPLHCGVFLLCVSSFCLLLYSLPYSFVAFLGVVCVSLMWFLPFFFGFC